MDNQLSPSNDRFWILLSKKLAKEVSPEELNEFNILLLNNPDLLHQSDLLTEMWQQPATGNEEQSEAAYMHHVMNHKEEFFVHENAGDERLVMEEINQPTLRNSSFFTGKRIFYSIAALFILIAGAVYLLTQNNKGDDVAAGGISSVVTKNGNRTKIVLPDGSQVWLNAGSNLDYNNTVFNKDIREVSLNGEAYFDVIKNVNKPFIIHTQKMDIKVLGTAFNVRSYSNEKTAEASLIRGSIEVTLKDRKDQKIILKPNEKISIANDITTPPLSNTGKTPAVKQNITPRIPHIVVKEIKPNPTYNIIGEIAWTQNKLYFEDERLEDITLMLERWFGKKILIINESLKNVHYYGNFQEETLEEVLTYLKLSKAFNYRIENNSVVIY
jgi:ferric-dicitrate binding protein FerR (iron transport regulator)